MLRLNEIHHIAIIVSDYPRSKDFYVNKLGLRVLQEHYRPEKNDWKLDLSIGEGAGAPQLEIFGVQDPPRRPSYPEACGLRHLAFRVASVDDAVKELEGRGIPCEPVRHDAYTGEKMTFFCDPDGLPIELHE